MARELLTDFLTGDGHTVVTASQGKEAVGRFRESKFDLVITDRAMPEMGGDQLAATIKQLAPGTPVIMLTGFGKFMEAVNEKPEGVDEIISKPPTLGAVRDAVARVTSQ